MVTNATNRHLEQLRGWRYDAPHQRPRPEALIAWARHRAPRTSAQDDPSRRDQGQLIQEQVLELLSLATLGPAWCFRYATTLGDQLHPTLTARVGALPLWGAPLSAFLDAVHVPHPVEPELGPQQWEASGAVQIPGYDHEANAWAPFLLSWEPGRRTRFEMLEADHRLSWTETHDVFAHLAVDVSRPSGAILVVDLLCSSHSICRRLGNLFASTSCPCRTDDGPTPGCRRCGGSGVEQRWWADEEG